MDSRIIKIVAAVILVLSIGIITYQLAFNQQPSEPSSPDIIVPDLNNEDINDTPEEKEEKTPLFCPQVFDPVCGEVEGEAKTFSNICEAEKANAINLEPGICSPLEACPNDMDQVCAEIEGEKTTFDNLCKAQAAGAENIEEGRCPIVLSDPEEAVPTCSSELKYVCGTLNDKKTTFDNQCQAEEAGAIEITEGKCPLNLDLDEISN